MNYPNPDSMCCIMTTAQRNFVTFNQVENRWVSHVQNKAGENCRALFRQKHRAIDHARNNALRLGVTIPLQIEELAE